MADLTPEAKRRQWIEAAKRRAAEKRGETYDPAAAPPAAAEVAPPVAAATDAEPSAAAPAPEAVPAASAPPVAEAPIAAAETERPAVPAAVPAAQAPPPAPTARAAEAAQDKTFLRTNVRTLNRREFLSYSWGAAMGLVAAQGALATGLFMYPRFRAGEFGGDFFLGPASGLPGNAAAPQGDPIGKFWLVNTETGPRALYMVCTHLGCLYKWVEANSRFECPCHGSKFTREGEYIEGPAPRSLDQFVVEVQENGAVLGTTQDQGASIQPPPIANESATVIVKTGSRIQGKAHS